MRILFHSQAPWVAGGYGNQTALFAPRMAEAGHEVVISAFHGLRGGALNWGDIPVWPAGAEPFGNDSLSIYLQGHVGDDGLGITLIDPHQLKTATLRSHTVAAWVPIDHDPASAELVALPLRQFDIRPVAMSRFGHDKLTEAGFADALYVPHGIDTSAFAPQDRNQARDLLGLPRDAFVVGMVAANYGTDPPRKAFCEALSAFAQFRRRHPDAMLYLHTDLLGGMQRTGVDLIQYMQQIGMPDGCIQSVNQHLYTVGLPTGQLAHTYSAMDVLLNPSYGEGFGIPIVEAQACGTPVIVNNTSAMPELVGAGWICDGEPFYMTRYGAWWHRPSVESIVDCLQRAYTSSSAARRAQAREFALGYDADRVMTEHWKPALDQLAP